MRLQSYRHCNIALRFIWIAQSRHVSTTVSRRHQEDRQLRDIVPGDLTATLEAHRASNRASIIRKVNVGEPLFSNVEGRSRETLQEQDDDALRASDSTQVNPGSNANSSPTKEGEGLIPQTFNIYRVLHDVPTALSNGTPEDTRNRLVRRMNTENANTEAPPPAYVDPELYRYGRYIGLPPEAKIIQGLPFKPWESESSRAETDKKKRLSAELANLQDWLLLTPAEKQFRENLTHSVTFSLNLLAKDVEFYTFGSSETGLATTMSDIDIGFIIPSIQKTPGERGPSSGIGKKENRKKIFRLLHRFCVHSYTRGKYKHQEVVHARFPLLRMKHKATDVEIQIVAGAARPTVIEITKTYIDEYPQLVPVYLALKATLAARELDESINGGVGSYTLLMMTVAAFKVTHMPRRMDLATALMVVLRFYGDLHTTLHCVGVDPPAKFQKRKTLVIANSISKALGKFQDDPKHWSRFQLSLINEKMPYLLCLQDPADPDNDLGRGAWRIKDITKTFRELLTHISLYMDDKGPIEIKQSTPLEHLLGNSLHLIKARRAAFHRWANGSRGSFELESLKGITKHAKQMEMGPKKETASSAGNLPGMDTVSAKPMKFVMADIGTGHDDSDDDMRTADQSADADSSTVAADVADEATSTSINKITDQDPLTINEMTGKDTFISIDETTDKASSTSIHRTVDEDLPTSTGIEDTFPTTSKPSSEDGPPTISKTSN